MENMIDMMPDVKEMLIKANKECQRIKGYIIENESIFDCMNLKLHEASFYEYSEMENDFPLCYADNEVCSASSYFYRFCASTYDQFTDWCAEEKIDFHAMCHHIGTTSQFYLYEKELVQRDDKGINWSWTMGNIFDELGYSYLYQFLEFDESGNVDEAKSFELNATLNNWNNTFTSALQYIVNEMYDDFIKEIEDVKKVYEYIKDIKDNQVEYFKEYLNFYEEELQAQKDEAEAERNKREIIIAKMPEKIREIMRHSALDSVELQEVLCFLR